MGVRSLIVMMAVAVFVVGCSSMPKVTRTGSVKDVIIRDQLEPKEVEAKVGDEIRYVNKRTGDVKVVFLDDLKDRHSCNNGFGGWFGMMDNRKASLDPNEAASICFSKPGEYRYNVRMEAERPAGERSYTGTVKVTQ